MPRRALIVTVAAGALLLAAATVALAVGELSQKTGTAGCISDTGTGGACTLGRALLRPTDLVVSPDGRNVYATAQGDDAVVVFDRDPATGELEQKDGADGCIVHTASDGCTDGRALGGPGGIAISADGDHVYVAAGDSFAVTVFDRDPATGELTQKDGAAGCLKDAAGDGCTDVTAPMVTAQDVIVSPDDEQVYVAASDSDTVVAFDRDPATGVLTEKPGPARCIAETGDGVTCTDGKALNSAGSLAASPDGTSVYVVAQNAVAFLDRDPGTGVLTQDTPACVSNAPPGDCHSNGIVEEPSQLAVSPGSDHVYLTVYGSWDAVVIFERDASTGNLVNTGCVANSAVGECVVGTALDDPTALALTPDGDHLYVGTGESGSVAIFDRDADTGLLTQKPAPDGCVSSVHPPEECRPGTSLFYGTGIDVAPDEKSVYVAVQSDNPDPGSVAILDRETPPEDPDPEPQPGPTATTTTTTGADPPPAIPPVTLPAPPPANVPPPPTFRASQFVRLPSNRRCRSRRRLRLRPRIPPGASVRTIRVFVNGRRVANRSGNRLTVPIDLRGLPRGRYRVRLEITLADGRKVTDTRRYRTCGKRPTRPKRRRRG